MLIYMQMFKTYHIYDWNKYKKNNANELYNLFTKKKNYTS